MSVKRNFGLDLIRAIAVLMVMISHLGITYQDVGGLKLGQLGVELFFVLSGFLIGGILIKDYTSEEVNFPVTLNFWIRRWFRTLPVYYLVLLAKFIFIDNSLGYKVLVYFFFLQNNFVGINFLPVSWSLVIEEWFYLTLPVFCLILFYRKKFNPGRFLIFIIGFIVFENLLRYWLVLKTNISYDGINANFPFRLDSLMWGVLLALVKSRHKNIYSFLSRSVIFIPLALLCIPILWYFGQMNLIPGNINKLIWPRTIWFTLMSVIVAMMIPYLEVNLSGNSRQNIFKRSITFISLVSYSAYLIHSEIYPYIIKAPLFSSSWYLQSFIGLTVSLAVAYFMYTFIEKPVMNLRDKVKIRKKEPGQLVLQREAAEVREIS